MIKPCHPAYKEYARFSARAADASPQAPQTPPALSEFVFDVDIDGTDGTVATRNANRSVAGAHYTREDHMASKGKMN